MPVPASKPSSISSSRRHLALEIVASLAAIVMAWVVADAAFRQLLPRLSVNSRTLSEWPERVQSLRNSGDAVSVLILGNSTSREGLDLSLLRASLEAHGLNAVVESQPADSSGPDDWYFEFKNMFIANGAAPDWLILPVGNFIPLLRLKEPNEDLIYTFLGFSDLPEYFAGQELTDTDEQAHLAFSKLSALYTFRGRLQKRILASVVPGYVSLQEAANSRRAAERRTTASGKARASDYWSKRIARLAREHGVQVAVLVIPTADLEGRLGPRDRALAKQLGWHVLEPAANVQFSEKERPDGLHLTRPARQRFTKLAAPELAALLRRGSQ